MRVLVTGGAGYIGSHMVLALVDAGAEAIVLDSLVTGIRANVLSEATFYEGDVGDRRLVAEIIEKHGIDAIAHFAASTVVPESVAQPLTYYRNNTANTIALLEAAVGGGVDRFVFSSTAAVYGNTSAELVSEEAPALPESPYGFSKLMSEQVICDAALAHGLSAGILRYFNVAGADPMGRSGQSTPRATHLIKVCVEAAVGLRPEVVVYGKDFLTPDGTGVRDFIHVSDLADAHLVVLQALQDPSEVVRVNCGYGKGFSVLEVIEAVRRVSGVDFAVRVGDRRPGDLGRVVADASRLRQKFGWKPRYDLLEAMVRDALMWEQKNLPAGIVRPS